MSLYQLSEDIIVIGKQVITFPHGIKEAFTALMQQLGVDRDYYGVSWFDENNEVQYYAMAKELNAGEAEQYGYDSLRIQKGEYRTEALRDWMNQTECIKDIFHRLMADMEPGKSPLCIEWYRSPEEMLCMILNLPRQTVQ